LLLTYDYQNDGRYSNGTQGIREFADMTLYSVPGMATVRSFTRIMGDSSPGSFQYSDPPPTYMSGGWPDAERVLENLMAVISQLSGE